MILHLEHFQGSEPKPAPYPGDDSCATQQPSKAMSCGSAAPCSLLLNHELHGSETLILTDKDHSGGRIAYEKAFNQRRQKLTSYTSRSIPNCSKLQQLHIQLCPQAHQMSLCHHPLADRNCSALAGGKNGQALEGRLASRANPAQVFKKGQTGRDEKSPLQLYQAPQLPRHFQYLYRQYGSYRDDE